MNYARRLATATLLRSGKVLIAGGYDSAGDGGALSSIELYSPNDNTFAASDETATMNVARVYATATVLLSGKVLIAGGFNNISPYDLNSTELYNPATNSFAIAGDTASMNDGRAVAVAVLLRPAPHRTRPRP